MPLLYDGPASAFTPVQRNVQLTNQGVWVVFLQFFPTQQNDIRLRGNIYVFRNLSATALGEFYAYDEFRVSNDRSARIIRWTSSPNDLISVVPFYDFSRIIIRTEGSGLA